MRQHDHHLAAYNAAFDKLGLGWRWDDDDYRRLAQIDDERIRIGTYVRDRHPHLLLAYDVAFLSDLIHATKRRHEQRFDARRTPDDAFPPG